MLRQVQFRHNLFDIIAYLDYYLSPESKFKMAANQAELYCAPLVWVTYRLAFATAAAGCIPQGCGVEQQLRPNEYSAVPRARHPLLPTITQYRRHSFLWVCGAIETVLTVMDRREAAADTSASQSLHKRNRYWLRCHDDLPVNGASSTSHFSYLHETAMALKIYGP